MKYNEDHYVGYDGTRMFMSVWLPDDLKPRALLVALHGLGNHGYGLSTIGEYLVDRGIAVFAPDLRGFGHYSGLKGHIMRFDEYIEDVQNIVMQVKDRFLNKITYVFGHSLGGLIAIQYALTYPHEIDGVLLHCPAVAQDVKVGLGMKMGVGVLSLLNVKRYFENGFGEEDATRDPEVINQQREDPLRFGKVTARFGMEALKAVGNGFKSASRIVLPVLLQQAGADKMVSPKKSKEFFDNLSSQDKTWKLYEGLYHELHSEPEKEQVLEDMYNWLDRRLPT